MRKETQEIVNRRNRTEWLNLINEWVHNEQDRKMLERHLLDGIPYYVLSTEFCLSEERVKARMREAKNQLFKHL